MICCKQTCSKQNLQQENEHRERTKIKFYTFFHFLSIISMPFQKPIFYHFLLKVTNTSKLYAKDLYNDFDGFNIGRKQKKKEKKLFFFIFS